MREFVTLTVEQLERVERVALEEAVRYSHQWPKAIKVAPSAELVGDILYPKAQVVVGDPLKTFTVTLQVKTH